MGSTWSLELVRGLHDDAAAWGITTEKRRRIQLDTEAAEPVTVLHELLHAIEASLDLNVDEATVQGLARGLVAVLADNPSLRAWLAEHLT